MPLLEDTGLVAVRVATIDQLWATSPTGLVEGINVVQLGQASDPWRYVGVDDVVVRPSWVHWVCPAAEGSEGVLGRQGQNERYKSRRAARELAALDVEIVEPITAASLSEWSILYDRQLSQREGQVDFLALSRADLLAGSHLLAVWRRDGEPVCGVVLRYSEERSALSLRLGAVHPARGGRELARGMYLWMADLARERRLDWVTLGTDVNFYGAIAAPGLAVFKHRFGFRAVPADVVGLTRCRTVVERVASLHGLGTPLIRLEHPGRPSPTRTVQRYVDGPDALRFVTVSAMPADRDLLNRLPAYREIAPPTSPGEGTGNP